eukprot:729022-Hanusia_phi.AAC.1
MVAGPGPSVTVTVRLRALPRSGMPSLIMSAWQCGVGLRPREDSSLSESPGGRGRAHPAGELLIKTS